MNRCYLCDRNEAAIKHNGSIPVCATCHRVHRLKLWLPEPADEVTQPNYRPATDYLTGWT